MLSRVVRPAMNYLKKASVKEDRNRLELSVCAAASYYRNCRALVRSSDNGWVSKSYLYFRSMEQTVTGSRLTLVTLDDLVACTNQWVRSFPETYDLIVGIPRSGLLVAAIIASKLGKPLTTPDCLRENRTWMTKRAPGANGGFRKILLVDDAVSKGRELRGVVDGLREHGEFQIVKAALFVTAEGAPLVDLYHKVISERVLFEWNLLHSKKGDLAADLEGVICHEPPEGIDADEAAYRAWMANAKPYLIPLYDIEAILSDRLNRYRDVTEQWLAKHKVTYKKLILRDRPAAKRSRGETAKYKGDELLSIKPEIYWAAQADAAQEIYNRTRVQTLAIDQMRLFS
jgi:orotate phosphoribosyltransferase